MSRCDQWIGLNKRAEDWVSARQKEGYVFTRTKEPIGEYAWNIPNEIFGEEVTIDGVTYREYIQLEPWSSGPMFFTSFQIIKNGKMIGTIFDWIEDKSVTDGLNYETGRYYV